MLACGYLFFFVISAIRLVEVTGIDSLSNIVSTYACDKYHYLTPNPGKQWVPFGRPTLITIPIRSAVATHRLIRSIEDHLC